MDITEIRRANLRAVAKKLGGASRLADRLDKSISYIGQIIGRNPVKGIGNALAREIENKLDLARGWLDQVHESAAVDTEALVMAIQSVEGSLEERKGNDIG